MIFRDGMTLSSVRLALFREDSEERANSVLFRNRQDHFCELSRSRIQTVRVAFLHCCRYPQERDIGSLQISLWLLQQTDTVSEHRHYTGHIRTR